MYEFFRGKLFNSDSSYAIIECSGVGYKINIPSSTYAILPEYGEEVLLYTHYHVTENSQQLYGFITDIEKTMFEILIGINKIGPKVAISILSTLSTTQIVQAVENGDITSFKAVSGIGPKSAQRLVMELNGKLPTSITSSVEISKKSIKESPTSSNIRDEAFTALIALGYSEMQVKQTLLKLDEQLDEDATIQDWITTGLQII